MSNSSIGMIDWTLLGATTPGLSEPGSDCNEWILRIPQSSSITEVSASDFFVSYPMHVLLGGGLTSLQRYSRRIPQPQSNEFSIQPKSFVYA